MDRMTATHLQTHRKRPSSINRHQSVRSPSSTIDQEISFRASVGQVPGRQQQRKCFWGHFSHCQLSYQCRTMSLQTGRLWGPRNAKKMASSGPGEHQPPLLMKAADVAFLTILLSPHLPFNVKRLLESTAFKE